MRVLASTTANDGHSGPLFSFVRACRDAGHEVAVAAPASYAWTVERHGFTHLPFDDAPADLIGPVMARLPELGFDEADNVVVTEVFGRIDAQAALPGLGAAIGDWQPDVLLRETAELGSLAAAERAGSRTPGSPSACRRWTGASSSSPGSRWRTSVSSPACRAHTSVGRWRRRRG